MKRSIGTHFGKKYGFSMFKSQTIVKLIIYKTDTKNVKYNCILFISVSCEGVYINIFNNFTIILIIHYYYEVFNDQLHNTRKFGKQYTSKGLNYAIFNR